MRASAGRRQELEQRILPATYEGTLFRREGAPILDLAPPSTIGDRQQRGPDLLQSLNRHYGDKRPQDTELRRAWPRSSWRIVAQAAALRQLT
jgi:hypothetical protein